MGRKTRHQRQLAAARTRQLHRQADEAQTARVAEALREFWATLTPAEQAAFLAEVADGQQGPVGADEPIPYVPTDLARELHAYGQLGSVQLPASQSVYAETVAAVGADPTAHSLLSHTRLPLVPLHPPTQAEQEQLLAQLGVPGEA